MESGSRVGPMSHLRPGAHLLPGAHVGNFGEVKNATIGSNVQMHHFSLHRRRRRSAPAPTSAPAPSR